MLVILILQINKNRQLVFTINTQVELSTLGTVSQLDYK